MKGSRKLTLTRTLQSLTVLSLAFYLLPSVAQQHRHHTTAEQQSRAHAASVRGVALSELAPGAPSDYTVKRGDTLWDISKVFLKSPWKWPELWGMNINSISNPHLIYPGQRLFLHRDGDRAYLTTGEGMNGGVIKVSPRARFESLKNNAIPTVPLHLIETFLEEGILVDKDTFGKEPRVVALENSDKVYGVAGDRMYARASRREDLNMQPGDPIQYRLYRNAEAVVDPDTDEVLGYEAQYVGSADIQRPEIHEEVVLTEKELEEQEKRRRAQTKHMGYPENVMAYEDVRGTDGNVVDGKKWKIIPATFDITETRKEIRIADRLTASVKAEYPTFGMFAAPAGSKAKIVSVYDGVEHSGPYSVVLINKGKQDEISPGVVYRIRSGGKRIKDRTSKEDRVIQLPDENNGDLLVFKSFDTLSYGLVLDSKQPVRLGDKLISPKDYDLGK